MNDEIKEILDNKLYFDLEEEDYIKIKDYITNLQEEKEDYKSRCEKANQYIKKNTHEYKMFNEELGHFSNLINISIDKNNKVFIDDLLKILGSDE